MVKKLIFPKTDPLNPDQYNMIKTMETRRKRSLFKEIPDAIKPGTRARAFNKKYGSLLPVITGLPGRPKDIKDMDFYTKAEANKEFNQPSIRNDAWRFFASNVGDISRYEFPQPKAETQIDKEARDKREREEAAGRRGRFVAVVQCKFGDNDIKEGIIFIKYSGAYELYTYDGLISASGSPGATQPKMKILFTIYDAEQKKKEEKKVKKQNPLYDDLEII
jgi:hypothetical protein